MHRSSLVALIWMLCWLAGPAAAQPFPPLQGKDLLAEPVSVPQALSGSVAVVIVGFSRGSGTECEAWHRGLLDQARPGLRVMSLVELEGAPFFVPGLVRQAMKKRLPPSVWADTVLLRMGTQALKACLGFDPRSPDSAYGAVLGPQGAILGRFSGPWGPERLAQVQAFLSITGKAKRAL